MSHQTKEFDSIIQLANSHAQGPRQDVRVYVNLIKEASEALYNAYILFLALRQEHAFQQINQALI